MTDRGGGEDGDCPVKYRYEDRGRGSHRDTEKGRDIATRAVMPGNIFYGRSALVEQWNS